MRRREFFGVLGGAAVAWPLRRERATGSKHRSYRHPVGGRLSARSTPYEIILGGTARLGYIDGQNVIIEHGYANGLHQLPEVAAELVRLKVDVIQASGDLAPRIAQQATTTIPIVAMSSGILGAGLVNESLTAWRRSPPELTILSPELQRETVGVAEGNRAGTIACHRSVGSHDWQVVRWQWPKRRHRRW